MKTYNDKKTILGQYFTIDYGWMFRHIIKFIDESGCRVAYDPFAGEGHLLNAAQGIGFNKFVGLDIDASLGWEVNDSLLNIPFKGDDLYLKHGYTNSILQVLSDNYSHKRNSKTSIEKVLDILKPYELTRISSIDEISRDDTYFLPDKGDKILFEKFLEKFDLQMESRKIEQNKYPDIIFQHKGHFYICELKMMKGSGGGQNKQIVEVAYFIKFSERDDKIHYLIMLDGDYSNALFYSSQDKIKTQRKDIVSALANNPGNYFVNTAGFIELTKNIFSE